jgi:hypothetical protein
MNINDIMFTSHSECRICTSTICHHLSHRFEAEPLVNALTSNFYTISGLISFINKTPSARARFTDDLNSETNKNIYFAAISFITDAAEKYANQNEITQDRGGLGDRPFLNIFPVIMGCLRELKGTESHPAIEQLNVQITALTTEVNGLRKSFDETSRDTRALFYKQVGVHTNKIDDDFVDTILECVRLAMVANRSEFNHHCESQPHTIQEWAKNLRRRYRGYCDEYASHLALKQSIEEWLQCVMEDNPGRFLVKNRTIEEIATFLANNLFPIDADLPFIGRARKYMGEYAHYLAQGDDTWTAEKKTIIALWG